MKRKILSQKQSQLVTVGLFILYLLSNWTPFQKIMVSWIALALLCIPLVTEEPSNDEKEDIARHWALARKISLIFLLLLITKVIVIDTAIAWYTSKPPLTNITVNNQKAGYVLGNYIWNENNSGPVSIYSSGTAEPLEVKHPLKLSVLFKTEQPDYIEVGTWDSIENGLTPMQTIEKLPITLSKDLWADELVVIRAHWKKDFVEYIIRLKVDNK